MYESDGPTWAARRVALWGDADLSCRCPAAPSDKRAPDRSAMNQLSTMHFFIFDILDLLNQLEGALAHLRLDRAPLEMLENPWKCSKTPSRSALSAMVSSASRVEATQTNTDPHSSI